VTTQLRRFSLMSIFFGLTVVGLVCGILRSVAALAVFAAIQAIVLVSLCLYIEITDRLK